MRIALIGYGKMGKAIEKIALERGHVISFCIGTANKSSLSTITTENTDIAIECSTPSTVIQHIAYCFSQNIPIVVGTTGWYEHLETIKKQATSTNQSILYATNFSIGVHLFFKIAKYAASLLEEYKTSYTPTIHEVHHTQKKDAPSGTAITLANKVLEHNSVFEDWTDLGNSTDKLCITSERTENIPGTHTLSFNSGIDTISLSHVANNREGFAYGAVQAAEWLVGRKGVFGIEEMIDTI